MSSHRDGPTYDTLTVIVQPWPDRTTYRVTRIHFDGPTRKNTRISSGVLALTPAELCTVTPVGLLERVLDEMRDPAQRPASPSGDHRGEPTLNLDLSR